MDGGAWYATVHGIAKSHRVAESTKKLHFFILFSLVDINLHPHQQCRRFPFDTPSPALIIFRFFDNGHSDSYEILNSTEILICISLVTSDVREQLTPIFLKLFQKLQRKDLFLCFFRGSTLLNRLDIA